MMTISAESQATPRRVGLSPTALLLARFLAIAQWEDLWAWMAESYETVVQVEQLKEDMRTQEDL